jgi:preprotein translocase subunit SecG
MYTALIGLHVFACIFLITIVLLQTGKGADMGAVFGGGSSETVFGSSGAGNFLTKLTTGIAILFMLTSLVMTYGLARQTSQSLFDDVPAPAVPQEATDGLPPADEEGQAADAQSAAPPLTETEAGAEASSESAAPPAAESEAPQAAAATATPSN